MAKRNGSWQRKQAKHRRKSKKSQHDNRKRLEHPNPDRKKTTQAKVPLAGSMQTVVLVLQAVLDRRMKFRFSILVAGMFLADDRRTASSWCVAAGVQDEDRFYDCLISVGRTSTKLSTAALDLVVQQFALGLVVTASYWRKDDSPTACTTCQRPPRARGVDALASTAEIKSLWRSVLRIKRAGKRLPILAVAPR